MFLVTPTLSAGTIIHTGFRLFVRLTDAITHAKERARQRHVVMVGGMRTQGPYRDYTVFYAGVADDKFCALGRAEAETGEWVPRHDRPEEHFKEAVPADLSEAVALLADGDHAMLDALRDVLAKGE